ncbi:pullulanase-type alpha-1,6-glucosidase [Stutzerimonas stutzeri]|uniref:pullulanase-type alpha-1,6-glucosidase n=1 Tax=Stutzerimonas stutzeri TaxID=316 RepID=UPI0024469514|nr:pullulanase-type alpha-1,6-glucosidase [Stutzerimonas stutzeri]MDH0425590.1 pullulanase-type alpha-1,6-glucosidase [Stutzerimonas stutzeri]
MLIRSIAHWRLAALLLGGLPLAVPSASAVPLDPGPDEALLYYQRADGDYNGWGPHLWNTADCNGSATETSWTQPLAAAETDPEHGALYRIPLSADASCLNLIMHKGDEKDLGGTDLVWRFDELGRRVFTVSGNPQLSSTPISGSAVAIKGARAHWLDPFTLALVGGAPGASRVELRYAHDASIRIDSEARTVSGGQALAMQPASLRNGLRRQHPHLADAPAYRIKAGAHALRRAVMSQLLVVAYDADDRVIDATEVQTAGILDMLFAYNGELGATLDGRGVSFKLWAPTAQRVRLHVFDASKRLLPGYPKPMRERLGVWSLEGPRSLDRQYYQYEVTAYRPSTGRIETTLVSDPYALSLSRNSQYAQVVDLNADDLKPAGWDAVRPPRPERPEASVIYETHLRDFSASDASLPAALRGTYAAFTRPDSNGMRHLRDLQKAGLTHVQLLPVFDIATIDEDPARRINLDDPFAKLCDLSDQARQRWAQYCSAASIRQVLQGFDPASGQAQSLYDDLRGLDDFNWGYDPFHFTAPEGSYASNAEGVQRIIEFRQMVQALAGNGLATVMDVVYNHTNDSGLADKSVLDKVVPGYYHRRNPTTGAVETSTCCENTASEHRMMAKLMIDSLKVWARDYKIAGFRFDLMGHHMREQIVDAYRAVRRIDRETYFYGEGWEFGEVAGNARGINANQLNMAGTGVGTFNDRQRDAVRGGSPFDGGDSIRRNQGFANGLYLRPNELSGAGAQEKAQLLHAADLIRVGIAGGLRDFQFVTADGSTRKGSEIDYNGQPAGYTLDPQETVNYVSKHDNQTLWDNNQYKFASSLSVADRVRLHLVALSVPLFSQGVPFIHLGSDILRSKSMQRDSYDSGDWFNAVDFSYQDNNWNKGLPRADKDGDNWPLIRRIIVDPQAKPGSADIVAAKRRFLELLKIRSDSQLFQLDSAREVQRRLHFHNTGPEQLPGVIAFSLADNPREGRDLDRRYSALMVVINASDKRVRLPAADGYRLHPVLKDSVDPINRQATVSNGMFEVPAFTTTVFVQPQTRR